jgi:hypothetical protein
MNPNKHLSFVTGRAVNTNFFYSVFSGIIYEVCSDEIPVLDDGQVPLISKPSTSCKHCYGRGYDVHDKKRGIYCVCRCMKKHIDPEYIPKSVQTPIEKFA